MRPTIAHVLSSLHVGGAEKVALMLARHQLQQGHRVIVLSFQPPAEEGPLIGAFQRAGIAVRHVVKLNGVDPSLVVRTAALLARERVDVVHTHNDLPLIYGAPAGKLIRRRVVHTTHGQRVPSAMRRQLLRLGGWAADHYIAVSAATAEHVAEHEGVAAQKLRVIINATDLSRFQPDAARREAARERWGLGAEARVLGSVGRLAEVKNQSLMLRAAAPLLRDGRCDALVIAGDGPERDALVALATELQIAGKVRLLGEVDDVPEVMAGLDVFTLSSRSEGLPLVLAEAMACSLPVVATDVGGVAKVVDDGSTGYLVAAGDEDGLRERYAELLGDRLLATEMGARGREVAQERYALDRMARDYARVYGIA